MAAERLSKVSGHLNPDQLPVETIGADIESIPISNGAYTVQEEPLGTSRQVRIVNIGGGASGLNMVRTLRKNLSNFTHVVYEKNSKVGGTWFENRYPGCKCDIPSHNYQFSWRPNPEWSSFFSPAEEIEEYLCKVCEEEGLSDAIKTEHMVTEARWSEGKGIWELKVQDLKTREVFDDYADFLLNSTGVLNNWKWPDIPGLREFKGDLVHSANWPEDFDYSNKAVAVIGNGSSGVQIVPAMQPTVKHMVHFARSPTWIVPPRVQTMATVGKAGSVLSEIELDEEENFTPQQIEKFKADPVFYRKFVKTIEEEVNGNFPIILKDGPFAAFATEKIKEYMTYALGGDERLCDALIPKFPVGCRRFTPGVGYLAALRAPNVRVVTDGIEKVVANGIQLASGEVIELDAIVCATGFNVSFCPRFPIIGRRGNLQDIWTTELPKAYMSCAVPDMPNYFTFLGPNAPVGHGSIFTISEHIAKYVTRIIMKCQTEGIKSLEPSHEAVEDFYEHINTFMPRTAWAGSCRSWFKGGKENGPVTALHPGSRIHFFSMLDRFRGEDFEYTYLNARGNRFGYLGNGMSLKEMDGSDSTSYLDHPDDLYL